MARIDAHKPSALIPTNYAFIVEFWPTRFDMDGEVVEEGSGYAELDEVISKHTGEVFGTEKKCGSCGARFGTGALFRHLPSGDLLFVGRDCSSTINALIDWSAADLAAKKATDLRKLAMLRQRKAADIRKLYDANEGLEDAMGTDHYIVKSIRAKLSQYGNLSPAQIALVFKLADEVKVRGAEKMADAPTGRVEFRGTVVSIKNYDSQFGVTTKATIKVTNADGAVWLVFCTVPSSSAWSKGDVVAVKATLERSSEKAHFAFGKRPVEV